MRLFLKLIPLFLLVALLASMFFWPNITPWISIILLVISIGMTLFLIVQKHWQSYQQAECTREKMIRNLTRDVLGLLLAMSAAIFAGGQAGQWAGMQAGLWVGRGGRVRVWVSGGLGCALRVGEVGAVGLDFSQECITLILPGIHRGVFVLYQIGY